MGNAQILFDAPHPIAHMRIAGKIKTALMRPTRISDERDIGEGEFLAHEIAAAGKMIVHHAQHAFTLWHEGGVDLMLRLFQIGEVEAAHGDGGFVAILFPEHPLQHLGALKGIGRDQR